MQHVYYYMDGNTCILIWDRNIYMYIQTVLYSKPRPVCPLFYAYYTRTKKKRRKHKICNLIISLLGLE